MIIKASWNTFLKRDTPKSLMHSQPRTRRGTFLTMVFITHRSPTKSESCSIVAVNAKATVSTKNFCKVRTWPITLLACCRDSGKEKLRWWQTLKRCSIKYVYQLSITIIFDSFGGQMEISLKTRSIIRCVFTCSEQRHLRVAATLHWERQLRITRKNLVKMLQEHWSETSM